MKKIPTSPNIYLLSILSDGFLSVVLKDSARGSKKSLSFILHCSAHGPLPGGLGGRNQPRRRRACADGCRRSHIHADTVDPAAHGNIDDWSSGWSRTRGLSSRSTAHPTRLSLEQGH